MKNLHLQLVKTHVRYALELADGDTALAASYFAVTETEFKNACDKYELLSNHNVYAIEYLEGLYDVYDLEVEQYHNFIANELCVHNCSDPNLQNIPSHEKSIRMLFEASTNEHINEVENTLILPKLDEVETTRGWLKGYNLTVQDKIIAEDNTTISITDIQETSDNYVVTLLA